MGRIWCKPGANEAARETGDRFFFSNYFRCKACESPGPWKVADYPHMMGLVLRAVTRVESDRFMFGSCELFDGTRIQIPAMGERYLEDLIRKGPVSAFLYSRLGNLLRACGQKATAAGWYEKAIALDPSHVESLFHLYKFARQDGRRESQLTHANALENGFTTEKDELDEGIAWGFLRTLREDRAELLPMASAIKNPFLIELLRRQGDDEAIVDLAAGALMDGDLKGFLHEPSGPSPTEESDESEPSCMRLIESLRALLDKAGMKVDSLCVGFRVSEGTGAIDLPDRHEIPVHDGKRAVIWHVSWLRELCRTMAQPPCQDVMNHYPEEYVPVFYFVERHVITLCAAIGDRTDQELMDVFSVLARRPDGKSNGFLHDALWRTGNGR